MVDPIEVRLKETLKLKVTTQMDDGLNTKTRNGIYSKPKTLTFHGTSTDKQAQRLKEDIT